MKLSDSPRIERREHAHICETTLADAGLSRAAVLDLTVSGNPEPPPAAVLEAVQSAALGACPDPWGRRARASVAARLGTSDDRVLLGPGAADLLWTCGRALARPEAVALIVMPGPSEFAAAARASGARIVQWRAVERNGHAVELDQVAELMELERPQLVNLCAPAWPSGAPVELASLQRMAAAWPDTTFVVDQTELELSDQSAELEVHPGGNVVYVRSISASLGLHGVGVGYVWARPELCSFLDCRRPSFSANGVTQAVAECWVRQTEHVAACRSRLQAARERLATVLRSLGLAPTPSVTGALLVRVTRAAEVARELLVRFQIGVCDCTAFGLPDHLRISGVSEHDAPRLQAALSAVLTNRGIPGGREA